MIVKIPSTLRLFTFIFSHLRVPAIFTISDRIYIRFTSWFQMSSNNQEKNLLKLSKQVKQQLKKKITFRWVRSLHWCHQRYVVCVCFDVFCDLIICSVSPNLNHISRFNELISFIVWHNAKKIKMINNNNNKRIMIIKE